MRDLRVELPDVGDAMVVGRLCSLGYSISRERIHLAIRSTGPVNTALRWCGATVCCPYSVSGPNSLWHIGKYPLMSKGIFQYHVAGNF